MNRLFLLLFLLGVWLPARADVSFVRDIAPVLISRCAGCHGDKRNAGGYRVHTFEFLQKNGASGASVLVPKQPEKSELYKRLIATDEDERMPQADDALSATDIERVRQWIKEGAKFDGADKSAPLRSLMGPRQHPEAPAVYRTSVPVSALCFAPGGQEVFVGGYNEVTVWNAQSGALVRRLGKMPQRIRALSMSPNGKRLLVAGGTPGEYGEVTLLDPATGKTQVLDTFGDIVLAACFNADGSRVAAGGADANVRVYGAQNGNRLWTTKVHADWITGLAFSGDGHFLASSSKDMTVKVYEVPTGTLFTTYGGHNRQYGQYKGSSPAWAVQFVSGTPFACSVGGKWLQIWDPVKAAEENGTAADMEDRFFKQGTTRYIESGLTGDVFALQVRDGQAFAAASDGLVKRFDVTAQKEVRAFKGHTDWVFSLDYDAATHRLASGAFNGEVKIWDTQTGDCLTTFRAQPK